MHKKNKGQRIVAIILLLAMVASFVISCLAYF